MKEQKYYRSPIDELVSKSNMSAKAIAEQMGIKYHRMVALRRLKDVQDDDLQNCERAIAALKDNPKAYRKPGQPKSPVIKNPYVEPIKPDSVSRKTDSVISTPTPEALAFMCGQLICLNTRLVDALDAHCIGIPCLSERKKQLEEQCNKLLGI